MGEDGFGGYVFVVYFQGERWGSFEIWEIYLVAVECVGSESQSRIVEHFVGLLVTSVGFPEKPSTNLEIDRRWCTGRVR